MGVAGSGKSVAIRRRRRGGHSVSGAVRARPPSAVVSRGGGGTGVAVRRCRPRGQNGPQPGGRRWILPSVVWQCVLVSTCAAAITTCREIEDTSPVRAVDVAAAGHPVGLRRRAVSAAWAMASVMSAAAEAAIIQPSVLRAVRAVVAVVAGRGAQCRFSGTTAPRVPTTATGCAGTEAFINAPKA